MPWGLDRTFKKRLSIYDSDGVLAQVCFGDPGCRLKYVSALQDLTARVEAARLEGEADAILAKYNAEAEGVRKVLEAKAEGYRQLVAACAQNPQVAPTLLLIEQLPQLVAEQVKAVQNLRIDKVTVWDGGRGGAVEGKNGGVGRGATADLLDRAGFRTAADPLLPPGSIIAIQTVIVTLLLAGFRRAVRVPAELRANWVLQMSWRDAERRFLSGVKRAASSRFTSGRPVSVMRAAGCHGEAAVEILAELG